MPKGPANRIKTAAGRSFDKRMRFVRERLGETPQHAAYLGDLANRHKA
jgi:hypothetical protein